MSKQRKCWKCPTVAKFTLSVVVSLSCDKKMILGLSYQHTLIARHSTVRCSSRWTCNKQYARWVHSMTIEPRRVDRRMYGQQSLNVDDLCWQQVANLQRSFCRGNISKVRSLLNIPDARRKYSLFLELPEFSYNSVWWVELSLHARNHLVSSDRFNRTPTCHRDTGTQWHRATASTALADRRAAKNA